MDGDSNLTFSFHVGTWSILCTHSLCSIRNIACSCIRITYYCSCWLLLSVSILIPSQLYCFFRSLVVLDDFFVVECESTCDPSVIFYPSGVKCFISF